MVERTNESAAIVARRGNERTHAAARTQSLRQGAERSPA